MQQKKKVVVVGNGMTSIRFCEKLLEYDAFHKYEVTVLGEELIPAYDRVALSSCFGRKKAKDLIFSEARWYSYYKMDLQLGTRVESINRTAKEVLTNKGKVLDYDILVLATGARPRIPPISGSQLAGVRVYRTLEDVEQIMKTAQRSSEAVVIGGGLLGLEAAEACNEMGLKTTIVERESHLMACQLDDAGGQLLRDNVEDLGLTVRVGVDVDTLEGDRLVKAVHLANGDVLPAQLVILATGVQPNDELGREAGLELGGRGGIAISATTQTSDPSIYAIGECASFENTTFGLVAPGYAMAEAAAAHLGEINRTFELSAPASQLKLLDMQVGSIGNPLHHTDPVYEIVDQDLTVGVYRKLVFNAERSHLLGAILMGETSEFERLRKRIDGDTALPDDLQSLLAPIGNPFQPEMDLADDDLVCFCNYVSKGDICRAIDRDHLTTTGEVMGVTYAAGLCGSCIDTVDAVTKHHLRHRAG